MQAEHARLESFEVVQIADANRVEVSMAPSDQQFLGKFEKLSQPSRATSSEVDQRISRLNKALRPEY